MKLEEIQSIVNALSVNYKTLLTKYASDPTKFSACSSWAKPIVGAIKNLYLNYPFYEAIHLLKEGRLEGNNCPVCDTKLEFRKSVYSYKKFCSNECKVKVMPNNAAESIVIDGIVYKDFSSAMKVVNTTRAAIRQKIFMPEYPNYRWEGNHDAKCIQKLTDIDLRLATSDYLIDWKLSGKSQQVLVDEISKDMETIRFALWYHQIDPDFIQIDKGTYDFLTSEIEFTKMFNSMSMESMAYKLNVHVGTITNYAKKYNLKANVGFFWW